MFFTLFYMYATILQWYRLGALKNKLNGTLTTQNALLLCDESVIYDTRKLRSFENLLFRHDDRIGCTVVPKQKINLSQWVIFPKDYRYFPIYFKRTARKIESPHIYILVQAVLECYVKHSAEFLEVEHFGELIAWKANENFEAILKTDLDKLTKLVHHFSQSDLDINHDLKILRIETVDIEGNATKIRYERKFSLDRTLKFSHAPVHWRKFVASVKEIYSKIRDSTNVFSPKITIENGTPKPEDIRKVPVSEVKPIKKDSKKSEDKNTLEVSSSDYRRHKGSDYKRDKSSAKTDKETHKLKDEHKHKEHKSCKVDKELKSKDSELRKDDKDTSKDHHHHRKVSDDTKKVREDKKESCMQDGKKEEKKDKDSSKLKEHQYKKETKNDGIEAKDYTKEGEETKMGGKEDKVSMKENDLHQGEAKAKGDDAKKHSKGNTKTERFEKTKKDDKGKEGKAKSGKIKIDLEKPGSSGEKKHNTKEKTKDSKNMGRRTSSSEKKLIKSAAVCEEVDGEVKIEKKDDNIRKEDKANGSAGLEASKKPTHSNGVGNSKAVKPPNILVYADSLVAKDSVKVVLSSILNKEKYTIYDLPVTQTTWSDSTVLVVVCGTVPPNLTFHLLQYLLGGGQLLCLCSDLLYSVLHTFTTAEVREHELVRFTYGRWKQVRMMHHIFCYQASPAKKQFSKDSDHSNQSSGNGSSPIAPRTPSAVEIQHNGKDYVIQVQVLGTEETWQTPSLLLATVKGSEGRAIFSQVHLEINPNEYEDDENKFEALKASDQARIEILRDILANRLDIDCNYVANVTYTPAYFLGRHDLKLNLFSECDSIKDNLLVCEKVTVKFCGKDVQPEAAARDFLPVFIHSCPLNFSTVNYFEALETEKIGRLVLYCDVLASSQFILNKTLSHGLVVIPRQQTHGIGRSNNMWISPVGSANFSLQLHLPTDSPLGKVLPLVQQLVMVAIVSAIKNFPGCKDLNVGIKWPNDLYANDIVKIGGLLVNSLVNSDLAIINIGCGINLDNPNPTVCINDLIKLSNLNYGTSVKTISYEMYFALVFNEIEKLFNLVQNGNMDYLYELYYKYWLHNNSDITIASKDGDSKRVKIAGIDDYGFLKVRTEEGEIITVQPDGNTFDMLKGLISPKIF